MNFNEKKTIIALLSSVFILIVSLSGYWILNKEQVSLIVRGEEKKVSTFKRTVKDLLESEGVKYDNDDIIKPSLNTEVKDYMKISVIDVTKKKESEYTDIPFKVKLVEDKKLLKGNTKVETEGKLGEKETEYELTYYNGKLVEKTKKKESILKQPVDKVVKKGINEELIVASRGTSSGRGSSIQKGKRHMNVVATAYSGDTITSTGTKPRWGVIAVDPRVIPYGTKVYIPKFEMTFVAEDCGGAIKGNKIDIFMGNESQVYNWGRRNIDIYIVN